MDYFNYKSVVNFVRHVESDARVVSRLAVLMSCITPIDYSYSNHLSTPEINPTYPMAWSL